MIADEKDLTPGYLAKATSLSQATVTSLIDKLESRDLVERRRDSADKRRVYVDLTQSGLKMVQEAPDNLQARFGARFSELESWEQSFLVAALERTAALLEAEDLDAAPVLDVGAIETLVN